MHKKNTLKNSLFLILAFGFSSIALAQLGQLDLEYYKGKGIDYKCTGGLVLPDSSVIVTGRFTFANERLINGIVKLTPSGEIDYSFNPGTGADEHVNVVVRQPDGKLIIGGDFITFNGQIKNRITRLNADGSVDATFNTGSGVNGSVYVIYQQVDGKILLGGNFYLFNGDTVGGIVRLNTDGSHDMSFQSTVGFDAEVYSIDKQQDGRFIVAGNFSSYNDSMATRIARVDSNGIFDNTFNSGGLGADGIITNATVLSSGKIIAVGFFTNYNGNPSSRIVRISNDGSFDSSFITGSGFNSNVNEICLQPDGKILATGSFTLYNGATSNRVIRLDTTGNKDNTFNPGTGPNLSCNAVFMNPDGKIYVGGTFIQVDSFARLRLVRLLSNGITDQTFFQDSKLNQQVMALGFQSSGKAIIGGMFTKYNQISVNRIARLNLDGSIDTTFHIGNGAQGTVRSIVVLPDDKILIGGDFTSYNGTTVGRLARLNADGSLDNGFTAGTGANNSIQKVISLPNGKFIITGDFTNFAGVATNRIARLNSDGTRDIGFVIGAGINLTGRDILLQGDGKIILVGSFTSYAGTAVARIVRIDTSGSIDNTFVYGTGPNNIVYSIAKQGDGKILVGGTFTTFSGSPHLRLARLDSTGTLDMAYTTSVSGAVYDILPVKASGFFTGGILIGGTFVTVNGVTRNNIVFVDNSGNIDSVNYYSGIGTDALVNVLAENQFERKIFVGGDFRSTHSHISNRIAALQNSYIHTENINSTLCPGAVTKIYFIKAETFFGNNHFTVQMSDSSGNFINAVNVGNQSSVDIGSDSAMVTIPVNTLEGANYRFRIVSSNPLDTSNITAPVIISTQSVSTITASGPTTFCSGGQLSIQASTGDSYFWNNGDTTQTIIVTGTGNYQVAVVTAGCGASSNTIPVTVLTSPDSSLTVSSITLCNGGSAVLQATPGLTYLWNTNETDSAITITQPGTYSVTVSNGNCAADSSLTVGSSGLFGDLNSTTDPTSFCIGGSATLTSAPGLHYLWSTSDTTQSITVSSTGDYDVTVSDGTCADTSSSIHITVNSLPNVQLPQQLEICANFTPEVVLNAGTPSGGMYSGSPFISNDTLYASNAYNNSADSIFIIYSYTDNNSCSATDTALQVITICGGIKDEVFTTLSISPNPATNTLFISSSAAEIENVEIINVLGETVLMQNSDLKRRNTSIDISLLSAGSYFLKSGEQKFRFIKAE